MDHPCWSNLPLDLLCLILRYLSFIDYVRFRSICSSWRSAVFQSRLPPLPQSPWLLLRDGTIFSPPEKKIFRFDFLAENQRCIGFSYRYGSVVILDELLEIYLVDPLTYAFIQLPSFAETPGLSLPADLSIHKSLFVGDTVVVIYGDNANLAFLVVGNKNWTLINKVLFTDFVDVVYMGGLFFALDADASVYSFDRSGTTPYLITEEEEGIELNPYSATPVSLVDAWGDLLQVIIVGGYLESFRIYKFDPHQLEWVEVGDLDGFCLLLGFNGAIAFFTHEFPELSRGDRIYFFGDLEDADQFGDRELGDDGDENCDLRVFDIRNDKTGTCYSPMGPVKWPPKFDG